MRHPCPVNTQGQGLQVVQCGQGGMSDMPCHPDHAGGGNGGQEGPEKGSLLPHRDDVWGIGDYGGGQELGYDPHQHATQLVGLGARHLVCLLLCVVGGLKITPTTSQ